MKERLKQIRKSLNLTLEKFGERLGVTKTTISRLEKGERNLTEQMFISICREFNVNEEWFRNGNGSMFRQIPNSTMEQLKEEFHLDEFSYNLVYEYLKLSEEKKSIVRELFYNTIAAEQAAYIISEDKDGQRTIHFDTNKNLDSSDLGYIKNSSNSVSIKKSTVLNTTEKEKYIKEIEKTLEQKEKLSTSQNSKNA